MVDYNIEPLYFLSKTELDKFLLSKTHPTLLNCSKVHIKKRNFIIVLNVNMKYEASEIEIKKLMRG